MSEKVHQQSKCMYKIRVDGATQHYQYSMHKGCLDKFVELCKENPESYVDIVRINTEIIMSQYDYHQMKLHFYDKNKG